MNQGNQIRAWKYDAARRLIYERIPEQATTINDGTGTMWCSKYTYTDFDAIATSTDARGVVTICGFDSLNRLVSISYDVSHAAGVAVTPNVTLSYDTSTTSTTKGLLLSVTVGGFQERYSYDGLNRPSSVTDAIESRTYVKSYQYNGAGQATRLTYPSQRVLPINYDSVGRLSSLGSYLSGVSYNAADQVTGFTLGNGVSKTLGYDSQRLEPTTEAATKGATTLMNLTYGYSASAGQMGAGTTAGNTGQLVIVSGTINGMTESASYSYDDLARLVTSSQTSNGTSAQRRFGYDRWGNRTAVWDSTSGGNQLQSVTLQQSGGAPTNRITSISGNGSGAYVYDSAGNVTADGSHSYTYDAESRLVAVDGGSTAQYGYGLGSRRVKKVVGGATTHYVWEGAQVLAEHDGASGNLLFDYILAAGSFVAKVQADGTASYFLSDRLSERLKLDAAGNVIGQQGHLPFGEDFGESGQQEGHHLTSYQRDGETSADYAVNRQYSATTGRFNRPDPAPPTPAAPQSLNKYAYVGNDPTNGVDPVGLMRMVCTTTVNGTIKQVENYVSWHVTINSDCLLVADVLEDRGNGGGGGRSQGPQKPPPQNQYQAIRDALKSLLNDPNKPCVQALASKGYLDQLKGLADTVNFYDLDAKVANGQVFGNQPAFWYEGAQATDENQTMYGWFEHYSEWPTGGPGALANAGNKSPYPGIYYISSDTDLAHDPALLLHEMMHMALGNQDSDANLDKALGINVPSGTTASQAITDWFAHDCH